MKYLNGSELASFIKVRQTKQVRGLKQAEHINPTLAIVRCDNNNPVIDMYVRLKKQYGADILIDVLEFKETPKTVKNRLNELSKDDLINGIILQLPVEPADLADELIELIPASKDVDGLGKTSKYDAATPVAIDWLLAGYGVDIAKQRLAIVGAGKLVGSPLLKRWQNSSFDVTIFDKDDGKDLASELPNYQVVVSATGVSNLIKSDMLAYGAVVIDAGVSVEDGVTVGDVSAEVRQNRHDITITPEKGGVGPLTVAALFDNVILSARRKAQANKKS